MANDRKAALAEQRNTLTAKLLSGELQGEERERVRLELADVKTEILRLSDPDDDRVYS